MTITTNTRAVSTVRVGRLHLEVWAHGGVTRCVPDESLCGYRGTHYTRVPVGPVETMARAAIEAWNTRPATWAECE